MNTFQLNQAYDRSSFLKFLRSFLDDFSQDIEPLYPQNKSQFANECYRLGHDNELDLEVYEIHHTSTNDARVGIAKDAFKLLLTESVSNRALVVFVPEGSKQWRLSLLQIEADIDEKGRLQKGYSNPRRHSYLLGEGGSLTTPQKYLFDMGRIAPRKDGNKQLSAVEDLQSRFSVEALTKEFYNKLYNWYLWAVEPSTGVTFPNLVNTSKDDRDDIAIKIIRLITRLLFVWFIKQKGLVPNEIFDEDELSNILANFDPQSEKDGKYYNAILQNLFFATLNNEVCKRRFMSEPFQGKSNSFGVKTLFRDSQKASWFAIPQDEVLKIFHNVPFMNCGLFECLDKYAKSDIGQEEDMFLDGFSSRDSRQDGHLKYRAFVPNRLFFAEEHKETVTVEEDKKAKQVDIPVMGLLPLLKLYNFTVQENTPSEVEVSLDPELLGQVFENLLAAYNPETQESARKSTGSFYTPRPIVEYMVNESLIEYLKTKVPSVAEENWRALISYDDVPFTLSEIERIATLNALYECKILDPACGSGAFPMGMLQQMVHITRKLDSEFDPYKTKLRIINNCIYGSDIQPIAMLISKLRFFISLICEQDDHAVDFKDEENNFGINTLPNLETKFVAANSLISADIHKYADDNWTLDPNLIKLKNELLKIRQEHFSVRTQTSKLKKREEDRLVRQEILDCILNKNQPDEVMLQMYESRIRHLNAERALYEGEKIVEEYISTTADLFAESETHQLVRKDINKINRDKIDAEISGLRRLIDKERNRRNPVGFEAAIKQLADWNPYDQLKAAPFFDADWMFGIKDGFDIVIGNPPYVQLQSNGGALSKLYENCGYETFDRTGDIYCLFYERGIQLLIDGGHLCYITSNKWMRAGYGEKTRQFFATRTNPKLLIDFKGVKIFESATVDTNILLLAKAANQGSTICAMTQNKDKDNISELSDFVRTHHTVSAFNTSNSWVILTEIEQSIKKKIEAVGTPLKDWDIQINYGIKTGFNDAFIISSEKREEILQSCKDLAERNRTDELIRPILRGKDIKRYGYIWAKKYLIATFPSKHYDIDMYPAVKQYLLSIGMEKLEQTGKTYRRNGETIKARKKTNNKWFETQDSISYWDDFFKPKIMYPNMTKYLPFYYDEEGFYQNDKSFMITGSNIAFLTAFLNSSLFKFCFIDNFPELQGGTHELRKIFFDKIPVIQPNKETESQFKRLVDDIQKEFTEDKAKRIDEMIFNLYNLTEQERKHIGYIEIK